MTAQSVNLTYDEAVAHSEQVLIRGRFMKADVFITLAGGRRFVVKDFSRKGWSERNIIGRVVIGREARAYARLAGIDGIPSCFKRLSPFSFAVEYLEGKNLGAVARGDISADVIRQFERIVDSLHDRGWVHVDLHRRTNILLINGKVFVVDLASALHSGSIPLIGRFLTALIGIADRLSLIKMKAIFAPEALTPREQRWLRIRNSVMPTKWDAR